MAHQNWHKPVTGASCPAPMTRAALLALRAASALMVGCHYTITDHIQNRLVAGTTVTLHAVAVNELSESAEVNTTYDNEAWSGIYDLDRGIVLELTDNRNNVARGINGTEVGAFDWGNPAYTNVLVEQSTLAVTYGASATINNVEIKSGSNVNLTGFTGSLNHFEVEIVSIVNFTNANGSWRYGKIIENTTFNASGYTGGGDSYYFEISDASNVNISGSATAVNFRTTDLHAMTIDMFGLAAGTGAMTMLGCDMWQSNVTKRTGTGITNLTRVRMQGQSTINHATGGALNISNTNFNSVSSVVQNLVGNTTATTNVATSELWQNSQISNLSASDLTCTRVTLNTNSTINKVAGSAGAMTVTDTTLESGSSVTKQAASTAGTLAITTTQLFSASFIQTSGTGNLSVVQSQFHGASGVNLSAGNRNYGLTRVTGRGVARLNLSGTNAAANDSVQDLDVSSRGSLSISCSGPTNSILYNTISGLSGSITLTGTTGSQVANRLKVADGSINFNNCTANIGAVLCTAEDAGNITFSGVTAAKSAQYLRATNQASMTINNSTGGGTLNGVSVTDVGSYVVSGPAAGSTRVNIHGGPVSHNGGILNNLHKALSGLLTTGNFNHNGITHIMNVARTLTAANTNRGEYVGLAPAAYTGTGILI